MDQSFDLPHHSDWLNTPLHELSPIESALVCQICKDLLNSPVITSCSHTFCSLCIRRYLSAEGRCPSCRAEDQEVRLRQNWALGEVVEAFKKGRGGLLKVARNALEKPAISSEEVRTPKRRRIDRESDKPVKDGSCDNSDGTPSRPRIQGSQSEKGKSTPMVIEDSEDDDYQPDDGLVACPICNRRMKEENVYSHLDRCQGAPQKSKMSNSPFPVSSPKKPSDSVPDRLPTINYSLMKENALRKKLRDLGIPDTGPKALLQRRHTEWVNLCNANRDSKQPKSKRELLRELEIWGRTQGTLAVPASINSNGGSAGKEFDRGDWASSHKSEFAKLREVLRKNAKAKKKPISSDARQEGQENNPTMPNSQTAQPGSKDVGEMQDLINLES